MAFNTCISWTIQSSGFGFVVLEKPFKTLQEPAELSISILYGW